MLFRFRYSSGGIHTHIRLYAGRHEGALGNAGSFCLRTEEWEEFKSDLIKGMLKLGTESNNAYEFINEDVSNLPV